MTPWSGKLSLLLLSQVGATIPPDRKLINGIAGLLINRICALSLVGLARTLPGVAENARKWAVTGLGLGVIPFIVLPIDNLVHTVMDNTTRKVIGGVPSSAAKED